MNEDERVKKLIRSNVVGTGHSDLFVKETNWRSEPKQSETYCKDRNLNCLMYLFSAIMI